MLKAQRLILSTSALALIGGALVATPAQAAYTSTVSGTVTVRTPSNTTLALPSGTVNAYVGSGSTWVKAQSTSVANGNFSLRDLPVGGYRLEVVPDNAGQANWYATEFAYNAWTIDRAETIQVNGGAQALTPIQLDASIIYNLLLMSPAGAVRGAKVTFAKDGGGSKSFTTNTEGRIAITDHGSLLAGTYAITYEPPTGVDDPGLVARTVTRTFETGGGMGERIDLALKRTAVFSVYDTDDTPLPGARVDVFYETDGAYPAAPSETLTADATGRVRLLENAPAKIRVSPPVGYAGTGVAEFWAGRDHAGVAEAADAVALTWPESAATRRDYAVQLNAPAPVDPVDPVIEPGTPTISGVATSGATLTVNPGTWGPDGVSTGQQWLADGSPITDATGTTLTLSNALAGKRISVEVTGTLDGASPVTRASASTNPVTGVLAARTPSISGKAKVGKKLTAKPGTWSPKPSLSYQWLRNGKPIKGATKASYKLTRKDRGARISVRLVARRTHYVTVTVTSRQTAKVKR